MDICWKRCKERGHRDAVRVGRHERSQLAAAIVRCRPRACGVLDLREPLPVQLARAAEGRSAEEDASASLGIRRIEVNGATGPLAGEAELTPGAESFLAAAARVGAEKGLELRHGQGR